MLPFLVFEFIRLIAETFAFVFWTVRLLIDDFSNGCFFLIIGIIIINILAYFWVILYNRKEEIKSVNLPSYNKSVQPYAINV
ncbi:hypothetical protein G9C98_001550 [Cotesia typhae]|uniref:Uncharacterized protein n=1 Tax=Cotesia typhae TaxID=2053667 RepID=A0A8J5QLS9_9HYME|nr:hypothetical protein G9C98_001550 [Cotesia typhae]